MRFTDTLFVRCDCGNMILPHERSVHCGRCGKVEDVSKILERWIKDEAKRKKERER
jgi:DNA-directed RNA polymerase subunit M/transcription elongation factor TFIIS